VTIEDQSPDGDPPRPAWAADGRPGGGDRGADGRADPLVGAGGVAPDGDSGWPAGGVDAGSDAGGEAGWGEPDEEPGEPVPAEVARLAAAVAALDELTSLPVAEHVRRYDELHGELSDALASIDEV
jgi:hypothetical protein